MIRSSTAVIRTPEGVEFRLPLAGLFSRMLAFAIDLCVIVALLQLLRQLLGPLAALGTDTLRAITIVGYFVISLTYGILTEWFWRGQTVGKRLLGLRVMEASGLRLSLAQVIVRNLMRFADGLPALYLVGGAACVLSARCQRLGDLVAGTIVIRTSRWTVPDVGQQTGEKYNSLAEQRHLAARLRKQVDPELVRLAASAIVRRNDLEPGARLLVFGELAGYLRNLVPYPTELVDQLSDEQYVRNALAVLLARR